MKDKKKMPINLSFKPVSSKAEIVAKKQQIKVEKKIKKETVKRRRYLEDNSLYGTQLFEPLISKEKLIAIHFPDRFTDDRTRISSCGKFAFKAMNDMFYELYYLASKPILEYTNDLVLSPNNDQILFDFLSIEELEDLIRKLVKIEFREEKDKLLAQLIEDEKQIRLEKDKKEAEEERLIEEEKELLKENNSNEIIEPTNKQSNGGITIFKTIGLKTQESPQTEISEQIERQEEKPIQQEDKIPANLPKGFFFKSK